MHTAGLQQELESNRPAENQCSHNGSDRMPFGEDYQRHGADQRSNGHIGPVGQDTNQQRTEKCQGLAIDCLGWKNPVCLAYSKLRDEGIVAACEVMQSNNQ